VIRRCLLASCACAALVSSPAISTAQQGVFVEGLSELTAAVEGTYGDEGVRIGSALDKMSSGLAEWDRVIQEFHARQPSDLRGASPRAASQMRVTLGGMYLERGRLADALRELDAASRLQPQRADVHFLRGLALEASARASEAGQAFRTAWALDANDPIKAYHAFHHAATTGNVKDMQGARDTLAAAYRRLVQDPVRAKASSFVGVAFLQDRSADMPILAPAAYLHGYARIAHGEYDEAIAEFRKAAAIDPLVTDPAARTASMMRAVAALRQGSLMEARALLEGSTALQDSSEAHRVLGLAYWADSQDDKSIEELEIAIRRNPRNERSRLALSRVLGSAGRNPESDRALQETLDVLPDSALARWWLGWSHQRLNRFANARQEFELAATGVVDGRSPFFASIGRLASSAADFAGAVDAFERSVSASPNDPTAHKQLAGAFLQQDRVDEAFVELVVALLIDPMDARAHAGIGQIHLNEGRYEEAVAALRRALDLSASDTEARYALATGLMRLGKTQEAEREFERVEQAQRQTLADRRRSISLDVLKEEAAALARDGRTDEAIAHYERAVALGADPVVYGQLAELYAKVGRIADASRARATYERSLQGDRTSRDTAR
jgi:tetratricopeptide (TPR) repeat protein